MKNHSEMAERSVRTLADLIEEIAHCLTSGKMLVTPGQILTVCRRNDVEPRETPIVGDFMSPGLITDTALEAVQERYPTVVRGYAVQTRHFTLTFLVAEKPTLACSQGMIPDVFLLKALRITRLVSVPGTNLGILQ